MAKKYVLPAGIVLAGIVATALLVIAKPKPQPMPQPEEEGKIQISATPALPQSMRLQVTASGTVLPKREIDLIAQVSGQIMSVEEAFVDGGFFKQAQILIRIDDREYQAALLSAQARLADAEKTLAEEEGRSRQARKEWRDLGNENANDLFLRKPQLAAARAQLASAQGEVDRARLNVQRTQITVPFDGRIKQTYADLGQFVTTGSRLATVYDAKVVEVRLPLTEKQAALVSLPLNSETRPDAVSAVTLRGSVAGEEGVWQGILARADAFVDANSRMYYAVVEVHDPFAGLPLMPGLFVEAEIEGKELHNVSVLPRSSLHERDKIMYLDEQGRTVTQKVNVLRKTVDQIWVQHKFTEGTLVTTEKHALTPDGTEVEAVVAEPKQAQLHVSDIEG